MTRFALTSLVILTTLPLTAALARTAVLSGLAPLPLADEGLGGL